MRLQERFSLVPTLIWEEHRQTQRVISHKHFELLVCRQQRRIPPLATVHPVFAALSFGLSTQRLLKIATHNHCHVSLQ
jgi:hypothetical protein